MESHHISTLFFWLFLTRLVCIAIATTRRTFIAWPTKTPFHPHHPRDLECAFKLLHSTVSLYGQSAITAKGGALFSSLCINIQLLTLQSNQSFYRIYHHSCIRPNTHPIFDALTCISLNFSRAYRSIKNNHKGNLGQSVYIKQSLRSASLPLDLYILAEYHKNYYIIIIIIIIQLEQTVLSLIMLQIL